MIATVDALRAKTARLEELQERLETIAFEKRSIASKQWKMDDELEKVTKRVGRDEGNLQFFRAEAARFSSTSERDEATERRLEAELEELALGSERASAEKGEICAQLESAVNQLGARLSKARAAVESQLRSRNAGLTGGGGAEDDSAASRRARELRAAIEADERSFTAFATERAQELQSLRSELAVERSSWDLGAPTLGQQQAPPLPAQWAPWAPPPSQPARRRHSPRVTPSTSLAGASPSRQLTTAQMGLAQLQSELMGLDTVATRRTHAGRHRLQQVEEQILATKQTISQLKIACA